MSSIHLSTLSRCLQLPPEGTYRVRETRRRFSLAPARPSLQCLWMSQTSTHASLDNLRRRTQLLGRRHSCLWQQRGPKVRALAVPAHRRAVLAWRLYLYTFRIRCLTRTARCRWHNGARRPDAARPSICERCSRCSIWSARAGRITDSGAVYPGTLTPKFGSFSPAILRC